MASDKTTLHARTISGRPMYLLEYASTSDATPELECQMATAIRARIANYNANYTVVFL